METALTSPFLLLKKSWSLALSRPAIVSYLILGALPQLVSFGFSAVVAYFAGTTDIQTAITDLFANDGGWGIAGITVLALIVLVAGSLLGAWYTAVLYKVYHATAAGTLARLPNYIIPAKQVTLHLLTTYIVVGLMTLLGFLLLVIPGIIIAVRYSFAPLIAVVDDRSVKPIQESKRLVTGRFWKLIGRGFLLVVAYNLPLSIFQAIHPYIGAAWDITSPIFGLYFYLVYEDFKRSAPVLA